MIIIFVQTLLTKTQSIRPSQTNWDLLRTNLCSEFQFIKQNLVLPRPTLKAISEDSLLFDALKGTVALTLCILSLCILFRLFRVIEDITNHNNDLINIPQYLLKTNFSKVFISIFLLICFSCLLFQFSLLIQNTHTFQSSIKKTICVFLNFPNDFSRSSKDNYKEQLHNHNEYQSQLRKNQKLLQQISMGANKIYKSISQNFSLDSSVTDFDLKIIKSQYLQLQNASKNLNTFISRARQIIYFIKYTLATLMFESNIKWFIVELPQIITAIFTRITIYSLLLGILSILAFFRFKYNISKGSYSQSFRLGLLCIFFISFCFMLNSTVNTVFVPLTGQICQVINEKGHDHILNYFPIDPQVKPTLQQLFRKIDQQSDGNLLSAFGWETISIYKQFLANTTMINQRKDQKLIYTNQIESELQKLSNSINLIIQNANSTQSDFNTFSLRVIGVYIDNLQSQICQKNLIIWSKIAHRQFWIAFNSLVIIVFVILYLLQLRKQQKYSIYSSLQPELTSLPTELDK